MKRRRTFAEVRGYRLEVPAAWNRLSVAERVVLQNGVGPDRWPPRYRQILDSVTGFRAAADVHDAEYAIGRTRADRLAADRRFVRNCCRIVLQDARGWLGLIWRAVRHWRPFFARLGLAWALYGALREGGRQAFVCGTKLDLRTRGQRAVTEFDDLYEGEV